MSRLATTLATALAVTVATAVATAALADSHGETPPQLEAREGLMKTLSLASTVTGDMARGRAEYDAEAAQAAAESLAGISQVSTALLWTEGTSADDIEGSRSLAAIWEDRAGFEAKWADFGTAAMALQEVAGQGQEQLTAAMGDLGKTCGACHETYRVKE